MHMFIFLSLFIQIFALPNAEDTILSFDDLAGKQFTSEEFETIMSFAQQRITEQLANAAIGKGNPHLLESLYKFKDEVVDKQVPQPMPPPAKHFDAVIEKPQKLQFSPDHISIRRQNFEQSSSKPQRQTISKVNRNNPTVSYVRVEPKNRTPSKPQLSMIGPLPPMTEAATNLWKDLEKNDHSNEKHDGPVKNVGENGGVRLEKILMTQYPQFQPTQASTSSFDTQFRSPTPKPTKKPAYVAYEINFCDTVEFPEPVLASYGLERIEGFVYNTTCNQRFFACSVGKTFSKKCQTDELIFDPNALSCNYKYLVPNCHFEVTTTTTGIPELEGISEEDYRPIPLEHERIAIHPIV